MSITDAKSPSHSALLSTVSGTSVGAVIVFSAFAVAIAIRLLTNESVPVGSVAALLATIALAVLARTSKPTIVIGATIAALVSLAPILFGGASWVLSEPLATTHFRCGTGDVGLPFVGVLAIFTCSTLALPIAFVACLVASRATRVFIAGAVAIACASAVIASLGLASINKPDPDRYLDLFDRATLEPGGKVSLEHASFEYAEKPCSLQVFRPGDPAKIEQVEPLADGSCPRLRVYSDRSSTFMVTDFDSNIARLIIPWQRSEITIADLHDQLAAPHGWIVGAMLGVLGALAAIVLSLRERRRLAVFRSSIEGAHDAGWVALDGHAPRFVAALANSPAGPVVITHTNSRARVPTYRHDGTADPTNVELGTRASLLDACNAKAVAWACIAITIAVATAMPLWAARLHGLL